VKYINLLLFTVAPNITTPKTEQAYIVTEGDNITCTATGYPVPDIVWLNNDGSVVDNNRLVTGSVVATGDGNISSVSLSMIVRRNDDGIYACVADNSVGNDNITVNITIQFQCKFYTIYIHTYIHTHIHAYTCMQTYAQIFMCT